jgi:hypothetical protein
VVLTDGGKKSAAINDKSCRFALKRALPTLNSLFLAISVKHLNA